MNPIPANPGCHPLFKFEGKSVRVVMIEDKPWFVLVDVCSCLGMNPNNTTSYSRHIGEDERQIVRKDTLISCQGTRGYPFMTIISESGLYKIIMRSDKPAAKRFQDWVTREVLPALRKDGMYVMGEEKVRTGEMSLEEVTLKVA